MRITEYLTAGAIGLGAILAGCSGVANSDSIDQKVKNAPRTEQVARTRPVTHQAQHTNSGASTKGASGNSYDGPSYDELIERSDEAIRAKDYETGLRLAKQARDLDSNNWVAYLNISTAQNRLGNRAQAIKTSSNALERFPNKAPFVRNLAFFYMDNGDKRTALQYFKRSLELEPGHKQSEGWVKYLEKKIN